MFVKGSVAIKIAGKQMARGIDNSAPQQYDVIGKRQLFARLGEGKEEKRMRRILCYGDSNTWGFTAGTGVRYTEQQRWTGVLQRELGEDYTVIEEGLNGRTTVYDNPTSPGRNGLDYLLPCLVSQKPLDLVVLMLGTNDLRQTDIYGAAQGIRHLVNTIKLYSHWAESSWIFTGGEGQARILLVAPIQVHPCAYEVDPSKIPHKYVEHSLRFGELFRIVAEETGCEFLDAALYAEPDTVDGLHMTKDSHQRLGCAIAEKIKACFEAAGH